MRAATRHDEPVLPLPARSWRAAWRGLGPGKLLWTIAFAIGVAALLNPIFKPSFVELLGRTVFVALVSLLAFSAAGRWRQSLLPRWLVQILGLVLAAPLATLLVYLVSTGGDLQAFFGNEHRIAGFVWIAGSALLLGLLLGLGALVREREALARTQALQFELERATLERQAQDARLALLTAQIEPHFLFNTLANVQALVETGSPRAPEVLRSLIAYLRAALPRLHEDGGLPTLANELALVRAYLELMHLRMPDRLHFEMTLDPTLAALRFPAMALLTLVENAVQHGIDPAEDGGRIEVGTARDTDGSARLWVQDSGVGLPGLTETGTGLRNLRERLASVYGPAARLALTPQRPHGLRAEIHLPATDLP